MPGTFIEWIGILCLRGASCLRISEPCLSDMYLLVIDNRQFPKGTFIKDLEAIKEFKRYSPDFLEVWGWRVALMPIPVLLYWEPLSYSRAEVVTFVYF